MEPDSGGAHSACDPQVYRFWSSEWVRFADLDLLGHVNNVSFNVYAESGRVAFLRHTGLWTPAIPQHNVVARMEMDYRHEITYPGEVRLGLRVLKIGNRSFTLGQGFICGEVCAATAVVTLVRFDATSRRSTPLEAPQREVLTQYL